MVQLFGKYRRKILFDLRAFAKKPFKKFVIYARLVPAPINLKMKHVVAYQLIFKY